LVLLFGVFQLVALIVFLVAIMDFYMDILIVTNQRVVDIEQRQVFSRPIAELDLRDVQDVNSDVTGFWHTLFGYGTVLVQTAGTNPNFESHFLRNPREIASIIADLSQQAKEDIDQSKRHPRTNTVAVINGKPLTTLAELGKVGALL